MTPLSLGASCPQQGRWCPAVGYPCPVPLPPPASPPRAAAGFRGENSPRLAASRSRLSEAVQRMQLPSAVPGVGRTLPARPRSWARRCAKGPPLRVAPLPGQTDAPPGGAEGPQEAREGAAPEEQGTGAGTPWQDRGGRGAGTQAAQSTEGPEEPGGGSGQGWDRGNLVGGSAQDARGPAGLTVLERRPDGSLRSYSLSTLGLTSQGVQPPAGTPEASLVPGRTQAATPAPAPSPVVRAILEFILPAGFPHSVTRDYLAYELWQFPVHVTGWTCHTLVTSTLLQAVGLGQGALGTVAAAAAIKWVSKDGIGAVGKLLVGGRFGAIFDEDPKQWRMYANFVGCLGAMFELATPLVPGHFLLLASLGNLTRAVAKGLKDPSSRIIQNHFAIQQNLGDVAAKQEVWNVSGQMLGLGCGVLLLSSPGIASSYWTLVATWCALSALHLALRFQSLSVLTFDTLNFKRAALVAEAHVMGRPVPDVEALNRKERLLIPRRLTSPRIKFGCSMEEVTLALGQEQARDVLPAIFHAHAAERHVLVPLVQSSLFLVLLKEGADNRTLLRSIWQAQHIILAQGRGNKHASRLSRKGSSLLPADDMCHAVGESMRALRAGYNAFLHDVGESGWDCRTPILKVPLNAPLLVEP